MAMHRKESENHFAQRNGEVEACFSGDQEVVPKHFQTELCNLEHHYQSKVAALTQRHAADCVQWEAELETAN